MQIPNSSGSYLPMVMEPVPHPNSQFVADMSHRDPFFSRLIHVCLPCTSIPVMAILSLSLYHALNQLRVFIETGLPFTSVTGLQLMFFPALAFVLVLQSLLLAYSIEFFVPEMSSTFSAVGGVILLILNCLLGTLLLFWIRGDFWMTTILAAILYELSLYTFFLKTSNSYFGPQSHFVSLIPSLFRVFAGSFILPLALFSALGEAGDTGSAFSGIGYAWTPINFLILVDLIDLVLSALATHHSIMWCFGVTWTSLLISLLNPAPIPIRYAASICTTVQFLAFVVVLEYKTLQKEMKKPLDEEMEAHSPDTSFVQSHVLDENVIHDPPGEY